MGFAYPPIMIFERVLWKKSNDRKRKELLIVNYQAYYKIKKLWATQHDRKLWATLCNIDVKVSEKFCYPTDLSVKSGD